MREMTPSEMLKDPMIRQMLRADRITLASLYPPQDVTERGSLEIAM